MKETNNLKTKRKRERQSIEEDMKNKIKQIGDTKKKKKTKKKRDEPKCKRESKNKNDIFWGR